MQRKKNWKQFLLFPFRLRTSIHMKWQEERLGLGSVDSCLLFYMRNPVFNATQWWWRSKVRWRVYTYWFHSTSSVTEVPPDYTPSISFISFMSRCWTHCGTLAVRFPSFSRLNFTPWRRSSYHHLLHTEWHVFRQVDHVTPTLEVHEVISMH